MPGTPVVPEGDGPLLPAEAALDVHVVDADLVEVVEDHVRLVAGDVVDAVGEAAVDEERLPSSDGCQLVCDLTR